MSSKAVFSNFWKLEMNSDPKTSAWASQLITEPAGGKVSYLDVLIHIVFSIYDWHSFLNEPTFYPNHNKTVLCITIANYGLIRFVIAYTCN